MSMTIQEAIQTIKGDTWTDESVSLLKDAVNNADIKDYQDPEFKAFAEFIDKRPFDPRIQELVFVTVEGLAAKGVNPPCADGCNGDTCALHSMEFPE